MTYFEELLTQKVCWVTLYISGLVSKIECTTVLRESKFARYDDA